MINKAPCPLAFRSPWWCAGVIPSTLPNVACPWLLRKPLYAAIGQLLTPYCSHGRHINSKQNNNVYPLCWPFLMAVAVRRYYTPCIARWRRFMAVLKAIKRKHRASTHSDSHQLDILMLFFSMFFIVKLFKKGHKAQG